MEISSNYNLNATFVSEKINKIRWRPNIFNNANFFITGSWDNDQNTIKLWDFQEIDADLFPFKINEILVPGDVTELKFIDCDFAVTSLSNGSLQLLEIEGENSKITMKNEWSNIHTFPNGENSSCTSFAVYNKDIASIGEDGTINLLNVDNQNIVRTMKNVDSCSLTCVSFLKHNEILTTNNRGQMKIWDIRASSDLPVSTFLLSNEQVTPTTLEFHPTQRHLVLVGDEESSITIWDLRHHNILTNILSMHDGSVTEIQFHPDHCNQLFSCSSAGEIWHWTPKNSESIIDMNSNIWLTTGAINNKFEIISLMPKLHKPINCIDLNRNKVLCGCDNEALYLINDVQLVN